MIECAKDSGHYQLIPTNLQKSIGCLTLCLPGRSVSTTLSFNKFRNPSHETDCNPGDLGGIFRLCLPEFAARSSAGWIQAYVQRTIQRTIQRKIQWFLQWPIQRSKYEPIRRWKPGNSGSHCADTTLARQFRSMRGAVPYRSRHRLSLSGQPGPAVLRTTRNVLAGSDCTRVVARWL
jgi:hypothetical protein